MKPVRVLGSSTSESVRNCLHAAKQNAANQSERFVLFEGDEDATFRFVLEALDDFFSADRANIALLTFDPDRVYERSGALAGTSSRVGRSAPRQTGRWRFVVDWSAPVTVDAFGVKRVDYTSAASLRYMASSSRTSTGCPAGRD
jgi:hypothetical protein